MSIYKIVIRLGDYETNTMEVEAKNWAELCNYVFGHIEIIDTEENEKKG